MERVDALREVLSDFEENNTELRDYVNSTEKDLTDTRASKAGKQPGVAIQGMLNKW